MMEPPLEAVPPRVAAVTMAVVLGAGSVREVAEAVGWTGLGHALDSLREARAMGLVTWVDGTNGTMRPTLTIVAASPR